MTIEQVIRNIESLPTYVVEIGVFSETVHKPTRTVRSGPPRRYRFVRRARRQLTNAELLYIQEHGTRYIPKRPVLAMTYRHATKQLVPKLVKKVAKMCSQDNFDGQQVDRQIDILSQRLRDYAKEIIYSNDGRLVPNAPATIRIKGFDHPLFRTGQLANSIDGRYYKIEEKT